mmetsp:Transcript_37566/g.98504  ORF Transcript_37566/g.98504 Transcript_37566/m.98504 type:complete len:83 (+) Transcript_37566:249-497(+)
MITAATNAGRRVAVVVVATRIASAAVCAITTPDARQMPVTGINGLSTHAFLKRGPASLLKSARECGSRKNQKSYFETRKARC